MVRSEIELKVGEIPPTRQNDIGRGIIRIDTRAMRDLGIAPSDVVELESSRKTVAVVETAYPSDVGLGIIRMDGLTRKNVGASITEPVKVRKALLQEAKRVTLAPAQKGMMIQMPGNALNQLLNGRALMKGDIIQLKSTGGRNRGYISPFEEVFDIFDSSPLFGLAETKFIVSSVSPKNGAVKITDMTDIELMPEAVEVSEERIAEVTYEDIGGLREEVRKIREMIELPLKHPELFERLGIKPPRGLLLHGPPGTGKTLVAKAVANETNAHFISISGPEVMNKFVGEAEKRIRDVFKDAEDNAPSIIFLDEIDAIAPKRDESQNVESRVVAQLLSSMDGIGSRGQVVVIAATNRPNVLDEALRRTGRFDREIELGVPDAKGRKEILQIHTRNMPLGKEVDLDRLSQETYGFVGADLVGLCQEAAMNSLRRTLPEFNLEAEGQIPAELLETLKVTEEDFDEGMKMVEPSAMRELIFEVPRTTWEDIGNLEKAKTELQETVEWPLRRAGDFKELGIDPPKGIILYGPPGTGKTLLAKAVAHETEANFISIKGPEILSKWVGESPKKIREIFRKARQVAPCIIFFDEMDSISPRRGIGFDGGHAVGETVVNQILTELDGLEELRGVVVIAASNRPDLIDPALLRPGRFDRYVHVPAPGEEGRKDIFRVHISKMGRVGKDVDLDKLAEMTDNFTGADIAKATREAAMAVMRVLDEADLPYRLENRLATIKKRADELEREAGASGKRAKALKDDGERAKKELPKHQRAVQDLKNHADKEHIRAKQLALKAREARNRGSDRAREIEGQQMEAESRAQSLSNDAKTAERLLSRNKRIIDESKRKADFELSKAEKSGRVRDVQLHLIKKLERQISEAEKVMSPEAKQIFKKLEKGTLPKDAEEDYKTVTMKHFESAIKKMTPTLTEKVKEFYKTIEENFEVENPAMKKSDDYSYTR